MGFSDWFGGGGQDLPENWHELTSREGWEEIVKASQEKPQVVFKHSTRCSVSSMAKRQLVNGWKQSDETAPFHYLDLIAYRNISNQIATDTGVFHESPQVIILDKGQVTYQASHGRIDPSAMEAVVS